MNKVIALIDDYQRDIACLERWAEILEDEALLAAAEAVRNHGLDELKQNFYTKLVRSEFPTAARLIRFRADLDEIKAALQDEAAPRS